MKSSKDARTPQRAPTQAQRSTMKQPKSSERHLEHSVWDPHRSELPRTLDFYALRWRLGRFVLDGVRERHDPRLKRSTASQLQLKPLGRRLSRQQRDALAEQDGITETSTASTSRASRRLRKSDPPPKSQMSLPGFARRSASTCSGSSETMVTFG